MRIRLLNNLFVSTSFLSKATEPVRKIILAENLRKRWRVQEGSQLYVTSTYTTNGGGGKRVLGRGDEGQEGEDRGDDEKADFVRG